MGKIVKINCRNVQDGKYACTDFKETENEEEKLQLKHDRKNNLHEKLVSP